MPVRKVSLIVRPARETGWLRHENLIHRRRVTGPAAAVDHLDAQLADQLINGDRPLIRSRQGIQGGLFPVEDPVLSDVATL
jgi:hypothetical protein